MGSFFTKKEQENENRKQDIINKYIVDDKPNDSTEKMAINKIFVDEIYFNNSKWRIRVDNKSDQLYFEYYKNRQWNVEHRIIH